MSPPAAQADRDAPGTDVEPPVQFGKYELQRLLARGGMGEVYLARLVGELGFEKRLVIKTILPELAANPTFIELFAREAKTAVALSHGNIVPTYELGRADDTFYIVMGYVDGPSVAQLLKAQLQQSGSGALDLGLHIIRGVLAGLAYAHRETPGRAAVVHRDITPRNVLIDRSGQVRIVDFGIAAPAKQQTGIRAGSIGYIAPEQARGARPDPRADVFSVSCLLFELCTLERAFPKEDVWVAPDLTKLPEDLREIVGDGLALDPQERPADAGEMLQRLRPLLVKYAGAYDDGELATQLKQLFPDGWGQGRASTAGSASVRAFDGTNETFATRLTAIEPSDLDMPADDPADDPSSSGPNPVESRATAPDGKQAAVSMPAGAAPETGPHAGQPPPRRLRTAALLLVGGIGIGSIAFAMGRSDANAPRPEVREPAGKTAGPNVAAQESERPAEPPPPDRGADGPAASDPPPTVPTEPPGPATVKFDFEVSPPDAAVRLDGKPLDGPSPYSVELEPGVTVEVELSRRGFVTKRLKVNPDQPLPSRYALEKPAPREPGFLQVSAPAVSWAEVRIDGRKVGTTPTRKLSVPAGRHRLEVVCIPDACPNSRSLLSRQIIVEAGKLDRVTAGP